MKEHLEKQRICTAEMEQVVEAKEIVMKELKKASDKNAQLSREVEELQQERMEVDF